VSKWPRFAPAIIYIDNIRLPVARNEKPRPFGRGSPVTDSLLSYSREERNIKMILNMFTNEMKKFSAPQLVSTARLRASPPKA
jgi:hypothetical protein